jgi:pyruvate,water dikinase
MNAPLKHDPTSVSEAVSGPFTLPFSAISAAELLLVGGKGANLGEMTQAGFPVPPGFCITTAAFRRFMQAGGRSEEIYHRLESLASDDVEGVRRVGQEVRAWLNEVPLPAEVEDAILAAWQAQGEQASYAVRSSATAEDLPDASFAGQQDTFLNVKGKAHLLESVRGCWVSLFTDRAILYRSQNNFSHREVFLAVVVQRMILPELSGILFTADPVSGHRQIVSIDASYGLGEALVAGLVSPDLYQVDKRTFRITQVKVGDKELAIRPSTEGGTYREAIEEPQRSARALTDSQVLDLAKLGARIEQHYGKPQDIEWCISQEAIYIVQSRPITSLFPLPEPAPRDNGLHLYFSFSHAQVMTDPMPPLAISFWRVLFPFGKEHAPLADSPVLASAAGRIYVDLTPLMHVPRLGKAVPNLLRIADTLSSRALRSVAARDEFANDKSSGHARLTTLAGWLLPLWGRLIARVFWLPPEGATERISEAMQAYIYSSQAQLAAVPPGIARLSVARKLLGSVFRKHIITIPPYLAGGMVARLLLARVTRHLPNQEQIREDIEAIGRGLVGNVTTEMDLMVGDLADAARRSPALVQHLSQGDASTALATSHTIPGSEPFLAAWERFMQQYGMRGPSEIDISRPDWREEPASLLQVVVANLQKSTPGSHRTKHATLAAEGEAAARRLAQAAARGPLGLLRGALVRRLTRVAQHLIPVREHPKFLMIQLRGLVRETILECAAILQQRGQFNEIADVWFVDWHELAAALQNPTLDVHERIRQRKQEYARFWQMVPPRVITSDGEIPATSHDLAGLPPGALPGSPVSAGIVEGIAKVILDPQAELLSPGEILIAPFTDPGWTPLFINAAGLVMETGGLMTHGSVVAREYGIPAVVAVIDATKKIKSGQRIRVNGSAGYVEILEAAEAEDARSVAA